MIKAMYLQKQAAKYRGLAREEASLEVRRQLFALALRCEEIATVLARSPLVQAPKKTAVVTLAAMPARESRAGGGSVPGRSHARLVHTMAD